MHMPCRKYFLSVVICCCLLSLKPMAQLSPNDSAVRAAAITNTIEQYHQFIKTGAPLYNGPQYVDYVLNIQAGHPFFLTTNYDDKGSVLYDGIFYKDVPLKHELVKGEVIIKDPNNSLGLILFNEKVSYFTIFGHTFLRLVRDSSNRSVISTGFYDLLYNGQGIQLLEKQTKEINESISSYEGLRRFIVDGQSFYIRKSNVYYTIGSKNDVLKILKDKKNELSQYIRKNKLNFKRDKEAALKSVVAYYDTMPK